MNQTSITIIGAGLAGCELALQLAQRSFSVRLIEQKPVKRNQAQTSSDFCELVCSNSFRGASLTNAVGLLKEEMRILGSYVMRAAQTARVPAGGALAVNRHVFSQLMTTWVQDHPNIESISDHVEVLPDMRPLVVATGPLTGESLASNLQQRLGRDSVAYYDAISPIVSADSINWDRVFWPRVGTKVKATRTAERTSIAPLSARSTSGLSMKYAAPKKCRPAILRIPSTSKVACPLK